METIRVALGVVQNSEQKILLSKRAQDVHQGGKWEFPGGKLEPGESYKSALRRELKEELGIEVCAAAPLINFSHCYAELKILFQVFLVSSYAGEVRAKEGQQTLWTSFGNLKNFEFPPANSVVLDALILPSSYLITPEHLGREELMRGVEECLQSGIRLVQLRNKRLSKRDYKDYAQELLDVCARYDTKLVLNCCLSWLPELPKLSVHLTSERMQEVALDSGARERLDLFSVSCHNEREIDVANELLPRCLLLGPVQNTKTHPGSKPIGWQRFHSLAMRSNVPVYALGGMTSRDIYAARSCGSQGVAAIRGFIA